MTMDFKLRDPSLLRALAFVNNEWIPASSNKVFAIDNPSTGAVIAQCPELDAEDVEYAIESASTSFTTWRKTAARARAVLLRRWLSLVLDNADDLARIITLENGKPLADAQTEIKYASSFLEWFSEEACRVYGDTIEASNPACRLLTRKEPVGVCGLIAPWNFPAAMITRKAAPALAAGCTVVIKAPGETPLVSLALAELASRAGFPPGVINVVTTLANTAAVGRIMTTHPAIKKVSFTGSTPVGKLLMQQSSSTLKKLSLELGGNAPFIVFQDANLDRALEGLLACKFRLSGQTCVCANRILVHRSVYETFVQKTLGAISEFVVGDGLDAQTTQGPLINARAVAKVQSHVEDAVAKGAKVLLGGHALPELGANFFAPTLLTDMTPDMRIASEETFGPVAAFFPFETEAEAIQLANNVDVGLSAYFYSKDASRCWRVAEALQVGMVGVNIGAISDAAAPFGGVKESGFGREGSKYGIDEYLVTKMVMTGIEADE
ncbi:aldehyde dehydrogenase family protein [Sarocladium implicatum]|nr:aldehyde dehydrogenase family protein [Sarocladium implicatum]